MKGCESVSEGALMKRCPIIIRIDGKTFHTFTKNFKKPFDEILVKSMEETTKYLCENIQGCVLGYTQSDEISLLLVDYEKFKTSAWFDYDTQKVCSISASMATIAFNKFFEINVEKIQQDFATEYETTGNCGKDTPEYILCEAYLNAVKVGATFDSRVFNLSKEEVINYFYQRQLDASHNGIQRVGQANFFIKELTCKSCSEIQDLLMTQKNINWDSFPIYQKRGTCVVKNKSDEIKENQDNNSNWIIDREIPIFKGDGIAYIETLI